MKMVDVGEKPPSQRRAMAEAVVKMRPAALRLIRKGMARKGDVLATAQIAGILAAKSTAHIIPLSHPISLTHVDIECEIENAKTVRVRCNAASTGPTGVEMEALTGAAVAALTIYDMCKSADGDVDSNARADRKDRRQKRPFQTKHAWLTTIASRSS